MERSFRLAVRQSPADPASRMERLNWLSDKLPEIAAEGFDLLLLPESFATGYNIGDQVWSWATVIVASITHLVASAWFASRLLMSSSTIIPLKMKSTQRLDARQPAN